MSAKQTPRFVHLAVDVEGKLYTDHAFAVTGDPWRGATILTPGVVADLDRRGLLPLAEISVAASLDTPTPVRESPTPAVVIVLCLAVVVIVAVVAAVRWFGLATS